MKSIESKGWFLLISLLLVTGLTACEHAEAPTGPELQPTFKSIQTNIFNESCALSGCHTGDNPPQGLNLSEGNAYENLVNVPSNEKPQYLRVDPLDPDSSYIIMKLEGDERIVGSQMPLGRDPLSQDKIDAIREWIANGANL